MARGWESKAIEAQQDAAALNQRAGEQRQRSAPLSDDEIRKRTERATVMLARTRALSDLQHACAPAHRAMLEQAIADLDRRLKALDT
jgi:hypothetical protein